MGEEAGRIEPRTARPHQSVPLAVAWVGLAVICFVLTAMLGRAVGRDMPIAQLVFWRNLFTLVLMLMWFRFAGIELAGLVSRHPRLQIGRAISHFLGQWAWFSALVLIPLFELFALEFTTPLWVAVLAPLLIGEKLTRWRVLAAALGFLGAMIIVRPSSTSLNLGTVLALASALFYAVALIGARHLSRHDKPMTTLLYLTAHHTVVGLAISLPSFAWPSLGMLPLLVALGLTNLLAQYGMIRALSHAEVMVVAPLDFARLGLIAIVGAMFYDEPIGLAVAIGTFIVVAGNALNLWAEGRRKG